MVGHQNGRIMYEGKPGIILLAHSLEEHHLSQQLWFKDVHLESLSYMN